MAVVWDAAKYEAAYKFKVRDTASPNVGQWLSYGGLYYAENPATYRQIVSDLGIRNLITPSSQILIVGCGFGYTLSYIQQTYGGLFNVWATDTSPYIQANKATQATSAEIASRILNIDVTAVDAQAQFAAAGAGYQTGPASRRGRFDLIVTELVVESLTEAELQTFLTALDGLLADAQAEIIHLVMTLMEDVSIDWGGAETRTVLNDPELRNLTLEQWQADGVVASLGHPQTWIAINEHMRALAG